MIPRIAEGGVTGRNSHHHFLRLEPITVVQRLDDRVSRAGGFGKEAEDLTQVGDRLVCPA
jgi:hypothetical protein